MIKAYSIVDSLSYEGEIKANNFVDLNDVKDVLEKGEFKVTEKSNKLVKFKIGLLTIELKS